MNLFDEVERTMHEKTKNANCLNCGNTQHFGFDEEGNPFCLPCSNKEEGGMKK